MPIVIYAPVADPCSYQARGYNRATGTRRRIEKRNRVSGLSLNDKEEIPDYVSLEMRGALSERAEVQPNRRSGPP